MPGHWTVRILTKESIRSALNVVASKSTSFENVLTVETGSDRRRGSGYKVGSVKKKNSWNMVESPGTTTLKGEVDTLQAPPTLSP